MEDRINVYNKNKFNVGIVRPDGSSVNIRPGSFAILSENEIRWFNSQFDLIKRGVLRLDDAHQYLLEEIGVHLEEDPNVIDEVDMRRKLSQSAKNIDAWLSKITEEYVLDKIYDVAMSMDLPKSKLQVLEKHIPYHEVMAPVEAEPAEAEE